VKGKSKEVTRKKKPSEGLVFIEREDRELLRNDCFEKIANTVDDMMK